MQKILVTGFGGFIGYTLVQALQQKFKITAFDNFSTFSNYEIKKERAVQLGIVDFDSFQKNKIFSNSNSVFYLADLNDQPQLEKIFSTEKFDVIVHLAALTGVRQSLQQPQAYIDSNVKGFVNLLECAKKYGVKNIIYASSSSVYGLNTQTPYTENQQTDSPISVYAVSKKADELLAHTYAQLFDLNLIGLRFFTVYGAWTRPDMAAYIFMQAIRNNQPIHLFNEGKMVRDFTYAGDVVNAIELLLGKITTEQAPTHQVFNIGNHRPILTIDFLKCIEQAMDKKAVVNFKPAQPGDMLATNADCEKLFNYIDFKPNTKIEKGVEEMVNWFNAFSSK